MSKHLYRILSIIILILIFTNSLFDADISSSQSGFIVDITNTILGWFNLSIEINTLSLMIRKLAHFLEFFALGFTLAKGWGLKVFWNIIIILLVASFDESIQLFSEGRAFGLLDIGIDLLGGVIGIYTSKILLSNKIIN